MFRAAFILSGTLALSSCSGPKPDEALVNRVEDRLAQDPCLRNIQSLRRTYQYARRGDVIDTNRIDVDVQEAGHRGLPAGRFIIAPEKGGIIDDSQFFGAEAIYKVNTDELDIWACGMNFGGIRHAPSRD
jgi:hypothetical protein